MLENLHKETYSAYSFRIVHFQLESKLKLPIKKGRGHGGARGVQTCQKISYKWLCPLFLVILKFFFSVGILVLKALVNYYEIINGLFCALMGRLYRFC